MRIAIACLAMALLAPASLAQAQEISAREQARIERILRGTPIIDGHNDLPWALRTGFSSDLARSISTPIQAGDCTPILYA